MPGVGKTALAVALAHRLRHRYPDAQLFLNLRGADPQPLLPASTEEVMQRVITAFRPEAQLPTSLDDLMPIYRTTLAEADRRIVLVLDNAANAEQIRPLLPPPNCLLLVTSRKKFQLPGFKACDLECLEPGKSRELLLKLAPRLGGQAAHAAELCGHLPLALEVFAGLVNNKQLYPVAELVERLGARQDRLAPVEAAFQVSSELLPEELRRRWVVLAVFPASFDLAAVASLWAEQRDLVRDELQLLVTANLVAWNLNNDRFRLHDLARQFCETGLGSADRWTAELRHAKHYRREAERADHLYLKGGQDQIRGLDLFDQERLNFESAFERLQSKRDHESATLLAALVHAVGYPGTLRFHPRQRIRWLEGRLAACKLIGDRQGEGSAMGNLGLAYSALGENRKAVELYEQAVAISRETGDRCGEGAALGNLGNACAALGETPNAIKFYEQSLVIHRENRNRRGEGNRLGSLGNAYSALGENRKAIDLYTQALAIHREIGDRRDEGIDLNNLGNAHSALGESRRAIEFQEEALAISRQIGDRRSEANALANLGLANSALGKIRKAIELHETALTIRRQIGDLRGEGNDLGNLGSSHAALGETTKAIEFQERALAISRQIGDRRGEGDDLDNLGNTYYSMHQARRAIELYENALAIRRQIGDRRGEGDTLGNLGLAHSTLGETSKATELHEQALTIRRQIGDRRGEGHTLFDSAVVLHKLGAVSEAIARAKAALLIFQAIDDPKVANVRAMLKKWLTIGRVVRSHRDLRPSGDGSSLQGRPSSAAHPGLRSGKEKSRNRSKP